MEADALTRRLNGGRREDDSRRLQTRGGNSQTGAGTASTRPDRSTRSRTGQRAKRGIEAHVRANRPLPVVVRDDGEPLGHECLHFRPRIWLWPVTTGVAWGGEGQGKCSPALVPHLSPGPRRRRGGVDRLMRNEML